MSGNTSGSNRVTFTKASADRIAQAVRKVEQGNRDGVPFVGAPRIQDFGTPAVRKGTFEGDWDIGDTKTVEICDTTQTVTVTNLTMHFWAGGGTNTTEGTVLFAKSCGTNTAVEIDKDQCKNIGGGINKIASFASSEIQVLGHDEDGCLKWYSITTCSTATTS